VDQEYSSTPRQRKIKNKHQEEGLVEELEVKSKEQGPVVSLALRPLWS
jgi:hypothetical protein